LLEKANNNEKVTIKNEKIVITPKSNLKKVVFIPELNDVLNLI
jgi:hypothetical protein